MTRALFVTVAANELYMPVSAWKNSMGPCAHITYNAFGPSNDEGILACAKGYNPDVIFYIGANHGSAHPSLATFKALRDIAPCVHYQSDVEDEAWFDLLKRYRQSGCFDLIVSQTGVKTDLIDMATLIAVDLDAYDGAVSKDLLCGFSGSVANVGEYESGVSEWDGRAEVIHKLSHKLAWRLRDPIGSYKNYAAFLKRCKMVINVSLTGSGKRHHVKWRVLEAAFADCVLLESEGSPIGDWFPPESYITYKTPGEANRLITTISNAKINRISTAFAAYAREHYTPRQIFGGILDAVGKNETIRT